jgi:uncharacterized protein (DUF58 family)
VLTRRGWLLALAAVMLVVSGRLLGVVELFVAGAAAAVLLVVTAVGVALTRVRIEVDREVYPPRVYAGSPSRVDIKIRNRGRGRSPVLRLQDEVTGTRGAQLLLGPMAVGADSRAAYRLPTDHRGIVRIGPLGVSLTDPFELTQVRLEGAGVSELTVYPHIDRISAVPHTTGDDPHAGAEHPNFLGRSGEDFYALRKYVIGDDLRRVHWAATARHDDLMVRQDELPWQGRATVLLDVRRATNTPESLELVISAAASVVHACWNRQDLIRVAATDGSDSGFATGHAQVDSIMEYLATVEPTDEGAFRGSLDRLHRSAIGGALVIFVANMPRAELDALLGLRSRFGWVQIVKFEPSSWGSDTADESNGQHQHLLRVTQERPFPTLWETALARHDVGSRRSATSQSRQTGAEVRP